MTQRFVPLACLGRIPESRNSGTKLDLIGVLVVTAALVALALPLIEGQEQGWPMWTWLSPVAGAVLFAVFVVHQSRRWHPPVSLALFREQAFSTGLVAVRVSALESDAMFMAIGVGYLLTSSNAHKLAARLAHQVVTVGALIMAVGLFLMREAAGHDVRWLLPALAIDGIGMGMALAALTTTVLSRVSAHHAGAAAGVLSTVNQTGNALGSR